MIRPSSTGDRPSGSIWAKKRDTGAAEGCSCPPEKPGEVPKGEVTPPPDVVLPAGEPVVPHPLLKDEVSPPAAAEPVEPGVWENDVSMLGLRMSSAGLNPLDDATRICWKAWNDES